MNGTCISLRGVHKSFEAPDGGRPLLAVDGVDPEINSGEIVALLGPNGAGKTTTLDMVLGFTTRTAGSISVFGRSPREAIVEGADRCGTPNRRLAARPNGARNRGAGRLNSNQPDAPRRSAGTRRPNHSGLQASPGLLWGEQQRLRFALALLGHPDLLVLDEPTTGMDVEGRREFWKTMHSEVQRGRTVVFATRYLQEAEDFAQRTVLMANGKIVADGPTDEVRRRASDRKVKARFPDQSLAAATAAINQLAAVGIAPL